MKKIKIADRVSNGMRWLDENFPGWESRIDLKTLDLSDEYECICGQVFEKNGKRIYQSGFSYAYNGLFAQANSWISAIVPRGPDKEERASDVGYVLGFMDTPYHVDRDSNYTGLQREWHRRLKERAEA